MRVHIVTAVYGRPAVTRICYQGLQRLADQWPGEVAIFAAGDEQVHRDLAMEYGVTFVPSPNAPLGAKWNEVMHDAWIVGADYYMTIGSDDLLSPALGDRLWDAMQEGHRYIGVADLFLYHLLTHELRYFPPYRNHREGEPQGPGRILRHDVVNELIGYPWWPKQQRHLDFSMSTQLRVRTAEKDQCHLLPPQHESMLLDVKTAENMWSFAHFEQYLHMVPPVEPSLLTAFPLAELRALASLQAEMRRTATPYELAGIA